MSSMPKVALDTLKLGLEIVLKVNVAFKSVFLGISMCFETFCFRFDFILRGSTRFVYVSENVLSGTTRLS